MVTKSVLAEADRKVITENGNRSKVLLEANARLWMGGSLALADLIGVLLAVLFAMQFRQLPGGIFNPAYFPLIVLLAIVLVFGFSSSGLYPGIGLHPVDELRNIVSNVSVAFALTIGVTFVLQTSSIYSRLILLLSWMLSLLFVPIGRSLLRTLLTRLNFWGEPVVIVGELTKALPLAEYFKGNPQFGLKPLEVFPDEYATDKDPDLDQSIQNVREYAQSLSLKTVLVVASDLNRLDNLVDRYRFVFQRVILVKEQNGKFGLNSLAPLDFSDILGLQVKNNLLSRSSQLIKRSIDVLVSFLGLVVLSPLLGAIALSVTIGSPGRVFYRQKRLGWKGKEFTLLKFRTMHLNADRVLKTELERNPELKQEWDHYQKLRNDPRITPAGKYLRKFSLDELPQLLNVARGEMSLVGPRPIMLNQRELYGQTISEYEQVRPGITGLWQVSGRNGTSFVRRAELDDEYIQRWSVWLDIYILLKTVRVVFQRNGAY